jgi:hypothetical protein
MAIYDPTQQIKELGQKATNALDKAGSSFVGMEQSKTAQTERIMGQIQSIRDEAELMHQEALQDEIDSTLSEISSEIFKQRKSGATTIDMKGFTNLNRKKASLKNMAANSKIAAKVGGDVLAMAQKDPYVMNKPEVSSAIMSAISDVDLLKMDPTELQQMITGMYTGSIDNIARVADIVKGYGVSDVSEQGVDEGTGQRTTTRYKTIAQVMGKDGAVTNDGRSKIAEEAAKLGLSFEGKDVDQVIDRLSYLTKSTTDYGDNERRLAVAEENAETRAAAEARRTPMSIKEHKDVFSRFFNGVTSGSLSEVAIAGATKSKSQYATKASLKKLFNGRENLSPEFKELFDKLEDNDILGLQINGDFFPMTPDGIKESYVVSSNSSLGKDNMKALQMGDLDTSGINLYERLIENNILPELIRNDPSLSTGNWEVFTKELIDFSNEIAKGRDTKKTKGNDKEAEEDVEEEEVDEELEKITW